jgi:hypothetical protein
LPSSPRMGAPHQTQWSGNSKPPPTTAGWRREMNGAVALAEESAARSEESNGAATAAEPTCVRKVRRFMGRREGKGGFDG